MVERPALTAVLLRQCEPAMDRVIYIHDAALDTPRQQGQSRAQLTNDADMDTSTYNDKNADNRNMDSGIDTRLTRARGAVMTGAVM